VTIALSFQCQGGVVLAADSQITKEGGLKYNEKKIFDFWYRDFGAVMCYAGSPDIMNLVCERMDREVFHSFVGESVVPGPPTSEWNTLMRAKLKDVLKNIFKEHGSKHEIELLCALYNKEEGISVFRARGAVVSLAEPAECLGVGDSSVLRFLSDLFLSEEMTIQQGLVLACYMVAKAKTYIAGCGGPTQAVFVTHNGKMRNLNDIFSEGFSPEDELPYVQRAIKSLMYAACGRGTPLQVENLNVAKFLRSANLLGELKRALSEVNWLSEIEAMHPGYFDGSDKS